MRTRKVSESKYDLSALQSNSIVPSKSLYIFFFVSLVKAIDDRNGKHGEMKNKSVRMFIGEAHDLQF